jgi:PAS domain S-box-containing protein
MPSATRRVDISHRLGVGVALVALYVGAARVGFSVAFVAEQVTTVWAPTGLALAFLLLWGRSLWPAVWLGAFAANASSDAPLWTAVSIATGNTLEAVVAVWLISRVYFDPALRRTQDGLAFIVIAAGLSTTISATVGVLTLCAAHVQPWARFAELWSAWWVGDALGALVVAPVILTTVRSQGTWSRRDWVEAFSLILATLIVTQAVFGQQRDSVRGLHPLEFVVVPFLITAAVRLGQPTTGLVVLGASAVTVWNTVQGAGPFASAAVHESLILLQVYTGVLAGTGLLLAAAITERRIGESRQAAVNAVSQVLADAPSLADAATPILRGVCENLGWPVGALWLVHEDRQRLRCQQVWRNPTTPNSTLETATGEIVLSKGVGLPGRVWANGEPAWSENALEYRRTTDRAPTLLPGPHAALAVAIRVGDEVRGVIEVLSPSPITPDPDLLKTMATVGNQIGQFVARKQVEAAIIDGQRRTRAILDRALDAVIGMDHLGRITEFNAAAERTFGYTREEAIGRALAEVIIPRELRGRHQAGLRHYLATGEGPFMDRRIETSACHADGHEFPVEVSVTRVMEDPPMFTGFVRDLTARAQAEREREELLRSEQTARQEAERANRAKDEFLATLSHELRTPLNAIVGWTRMLLEGTMDEASTRRALDVIDRNAHLQVHLVEDILDVSRIITGGLRLDLTPVDLATVIGAALDAIRPAADAKKIRILCRLDAVNRLAKGDPQRLQQIVWNLLANAVKFTASGGRIDVELVNAGEQSIRISVGDDGAGIDPSFLPFVFERFRQADGSVNREHGGLGLGLAIVRHLVELHGGTVWAESQGLKQGATFVVEIPTMEPNQVLSAGEQRESIRVDRSPSSDALALQGCRALVVDDEQDARVMLATVLKRAGATVWTASTAREALIHLDMSRPDVLLADIGMPGEDGYSLIREIRRREAQEGRHLPAAAITAYAGNEDHERALKAGFDCHVSKPIVPAKFVRTVVALYGQREALDGTH